VVVSTVNRRAMLAAMGSYMGPPEGLAGAVLVVPKTLITAALRQ
jgi:hypothetical protein